MTEKPIPTSDGHDKPFHRYAMVTLKALGLILGLAVLVHVSWNMFAPDLLGLTPMRMKQALGLVIFAGAFASVVRIATARRYPGKAC